MKIILNRGSCLYYFSTNVVIHWFVMFEYQVYKYVSVSFMCNIVKHPHHRYLFYAFQDDFVLQLDRTAL